MTEIEMAAAFVVGAIAVARATRLFVDDDMPVFKWVRESWVMFWADRKHHAWGELIVCSFCVSIWLAIASLTWAWVSELHWTWWFFHVWLAGAYVAAMINVRDLPPEDRA